MGRWSTYRRRGGGPRGSPPLAFMTNADITDVDAAVVDYSANIDALGFAHTGFQSLPSSHLSGTVNQLDPNSITVYFGGTVTGDTTLTYNGTAPGIKSPDTIAY